ncbi:hypothetical protein MRX96_042572 [Rhipicephalus microplus]
MDAPDKDPSATEAEKPTHKRSKRDDRSRRRAENHEVSPSSRRGDMAGSQISSALTGADDRSQVSRRSSSSRRTRRSASSKHAPSDSARAEVEAAVSHPEVTSNMPVAPPSRISPPVVPQAPVATASPLVLPLAGDAAAVEAASGAVPVQDETSEKPTPATPGGPTEPSGRESKQETPAAATAAEPEAVLAEPPLPEEAAEHRQEPVHTARLTNAPEERLESRRPVVIAAVAIIVFVLVVAILKQLRASPTKCGDCANSTQAI